MPDEPKAGARLLPGGRSWAARTDPLRAGPPPAGSPSPGQPSSPSPAPDAPDVTAAVAALASGENFPVALRLLPARYRRHLMAIYVFARTVDDVGDRAAPASRLRLLDELDADVRRLYAPGGEPALPAVRGLAPAVAQCGIEARPLLDLIQANRQDQQVDRYQTLDDLLGYCRLSADPVGRMVLRVFGCYTPDRVELSDRVCSALQLAEHWQDVAEDLALGRVYLPQQDLAAHGCTEADLAAAHAGPQLRALLAAQVQQARGLLDSGAPLIGTLRGAARLAVAGYVAGGRAALAAIAAAGYDVLAGAPKPGQAATARELAVAFARGR